MCVNVCVCVFKWRCRACGKKGRKPVETRRGESYWLPFERATCWSVPADQMGGADGPRGPLWKLLVTCDPSPPATEHPQSQPYGGLEANSSLSPACIYGEQTQRIAWGGRERESISFFPDATTLAPGHFIPLPKQLQRFGQEIKSDSAQAPNHLFTGNTGTEEQVKRHHGDYNQQNPEREKLYRTND